MYQQSPYPPQPAFGAGAVNVPGLLGQVLGITGVGFLLTALAAYLFRDISPVLGLVAFGIAFILIFVMHGVRNNPQTALLIFYAFTFLEGIGLAPTISNYVSNFGGGIVFNAAATTGFGMLVLGGIAFVFSVDWRRFSGIAFGLLIALVVAGIISIFTLITLVDFSRIRAGGGGATAVELAIAIYLDALNIFIALLQLFASRSSSREE
jgi:modulator of FtsH protease